MSQNIFLIKYREKKKLLQTTEIRFKVRLCWIPVISQGFDKQNVNTLASASKWLTAESKLPMQMD